MSVQVNEAVRFGDVLDAVDALSTEDQCTLLDIVSHRLAEQGRKRIVADVREADREFAEGRCRVVTVDELRDEMGL